MNETLYLVYVLFPTMAEAGRVSNLILEKRLCACTNIYPDVRSSFWWENKIEQCVEVSMYAKTSSSKLEKLIETITEEHSYDCPCVIATVIEKGDEAYLQWVAHVTNETTL